MRIDIYPEGGQLVVGVYNQIGILVDNGSEQGVAVNNLELVDDTGKVIVRNIATNQFGMGKTGFIVEQDRRYYLQRQRPGLSAIREELPNATKDQFGINVDNMGKDKVLFKLLASNETFESNNGSAYTLAIYQDDFIIYKEVRILPDEPVISLDREELPYGVITAVLFNTESMPVSFRMFFNYRDDETLVNDLELEHCLTEFGDSIQVDLILPKAYRNQANLSMSALPEVSRGSNPDNSIVSSFLLRPYVSKQFKDHYYFDDFDRRKRFELDIRLLIEGWGSYDWDSRMLREVKKEYEMENGISFEGKVIDADLTEESQVSFVAELSAAIGFEELNSDKSFMGNMVLFEGDSLGISLISKKGKLRKPRVDLQFDKGLIAPIEINGWMASETMKKQGEGIEEISVSEPLNIGERTIVLEEVTVVERAIQTNKTEMFISNFGSDGVISEGRIIGDAEIEKYQSVSTYLATLGYKRSRGIDPDGFYVDVLLNPKNNAPVAVNSGLLNLPLSRVQAIYFDVDKKLYVNIVMRSNPYEKPEDRNKFIKFVIENGYARPQDYFSPNYAAYRSSLFRYYGAIDWKSNINVGIDVPTSITIPIKDQDKIRLNIEGMTGNGQVVFESELIQVGK